MRYGFILPGGSAPEQVEQARAAEAAGWDGVFVWEAAYGVDAWTLLGAMAQVTDRVALGTMLTPLPWRRPWKVASQAATLDQLCGGRAVLAVGLGATDAVLGDFGEETDRAIRAQRLDEGIDLIVALWEGKKTYRGTHFRIKAAGVKPQRRVPIWVVGAWPYPKSMSRALRCDGLVPICMDEKKKLRATEPDDIREMVAWLDANGGRRKDFDVVMEGETSGVDEADAKIVERWEEAGCTWWLESRWQLPSGRAGQVELVRRIEAGPPAKRGP